jgi:bifunctional DNA-binding transcriptional regulator/antitoxin component of YhaV-PrlF toxin-antitoxin module
MEADMRDTLTVQVAQRGVMTLPKPLRQVYDIKPGDIFTLLDLGGVFVLAPRRSEVDSLADRIATMLTEQGETLDSMLQTLRQERETGGIPSSRS